MRLRRKKNRHVRRRARRLETLTHNPGVDHPGEIGESTMSDFWKNREAMRNRTKQIREGIPENPTAPPVGPGSPAAEHKAAQEKLTAACDQTAQNQPKGTGGL